MIRPVLFVALAAALPLISSAYAQEEPHVTACREAAIIALREKTPDVKDVILDMDSLIIARADSKIEDIPVKGVVTGDAYLKTDKSDKPRHMVCIVGEKNKALLTFFTER